MTNNDKINGLKQLNNTLGAVADKKTAEAINGKKQSGCSGLLVAFAAIAGLGLFVWLLLMFLIGNVEKSFLERTDGYENKFRKFAEAVASLPPTSEKSAGFLDPQGRYARARLLIIRDQPDNNNRLVSRLQYNLPEKRTPQLPEEVELVVRLTIKSNRVFMSTGKFSSKFPIYDFVIDFIDPKTRKIFAQEFVKGDPSYPEGRRNHIHPGTLPIGQVQQLLQNKLGYSAAWAWHQL